MLRLLLVFLPLTLLAFFPAFELNAAAPAVPAYATYAGGSGGERGSAIAVDAAGNVYLAGTSDSPNFPALRAPYPVPHAFLVKLDGTGANFTSTAESRWTPPGTRW